MDEFEYIDVENVDDISDVYPDDVAEDIVEKVLEGSGADASAPSAENDNIEVNIDLSEINSYFEENNSTLESISLKLDDIEHELSKTENYCIIVMFLVAAFVVINIVRKLFDIF